MEKSLKYKLLHFTFLIKKNQNHVFYKRKKYKIMRTLILTLIFAGMFTGDLLAQQLPNFSVYRDHWNIINPAALSNNYLINNLNKSIGVSHRSQWVGVNDAPTTSLVNFEWVSDKRNSIFGGHIVNDQTGKIGQTGIYGQYAYRLNLGKRTDQTLSIGLTAGVVQYSAQLSQIQFFDIEEQPLTDDNFIYPDFGMGIFYHYSDKYYAGFSMPQTFSLETRFETRDKSFAFDRTQHLYFVAGGYYQVTWFGNETSFVEPSVWIKYVPNAPLTIDLNARYQISELIWAGLGLASGFGDETSSRLNLEAGVILGEQINLTKGQLKLGMAFDLPFTGGLNNYLPFAFEANAVYSF